MHLKANKLLFFSVLLMLLVVGLGIYFRPAQMGGGNYYFVVVSQSMEPVMNVGDWVICRKTGFDGVQVGDIAVVKHPSQDMIIVHRVVERNESSLWLKGDNCDSKDTFSTEENRFLAKYTGFKIPKLGYLLVFSRTLLGVVLIYYIPCCAIILIQVRKWKKRARTLKT